jgi:hypothetical protein
MCAYLGQVKVFPGRKAVLLPKRIPDGTLRFGIRFQPKKRFDLSTIFDHPAC